MGGLKFLLLFTLNTWATVIPLGQKNIDHYTGPTGPLAVSGQRYYFLEDYNRKIYIEARIEPDFFELGDFFDNDFYTGVTCPNEIYEEHYEYLRYLNRLSALSYMFESMREYERLGSVFEVKACGFNWEKIISSCQPRSEEMSIFTKMAKVFLKDIDPVRVAFELTTKAAKIKRMNELKTERRSFVSQRIGLSCEDNCNDFNEVQLQSQLSSICLAEKDLFNKICSEKDSLYGLSKVPEAYRVLSQSTAMRSFISQGENYGPGCLRRFIDQTKGHEKNYSELKIIFSHMYQQNQDLSSTQYKEGRLFPIGATREFREKGLVTIFKPEVKKLVPVVREEIPKVEPKVEVKKVEEKPKIVKKKSRPKKKKVKPVKKLPPKEKLSAFAVASNLQRKFGLEQVSVDMNKFQYDYIFGPKQVEKIEEKVLNFASFKSLKEMKDFDKLGSKTAPVPLKFLKFLIDRGQHQKIYNMINILGDSFYVFNDIDKKKTISLVQLKNDESTQFQWGISILKEAANTK